MNFKLQIYNEQCHNLAKSLLLKSDLLAKDTEYLLYGNSSFLNTPRTQWKYYLNISGEYHKSNSPMYITSLDSLEDIEFTKENLRLHPVTKSKYRPGDDLTKKLMELYPDNLLLIMGIIYDVDMQTVINADEFTILAYDNGLVGSQEIDLIPNLQIRLQNEFRTSINKDYADIETYYATVSMAHVAKQAELTIKILRLANYRKTTACDFYIWDHINSKLYLEDLKDHLSKEDIFYLYKNIGRLVKQAGTNMVLEEIITQFLLTKNISTYRLNMTMDNRMIDLEDGVQTTTYLEESVLEDKVYREVDFKEYLAYFETSSNYQLDDYEKTLDGRMKVSNDTAKSRILKIFEVMQESVDSQILLTDIDIYAQAGINGVYNTIHNIANHITGAVHSLTTHEAFILYNYLVKVRLGSNVEFIEPHSFYMVPETTKPSAEYLMSKYGLTNDEAEGLRAVVPDYPTELQNRIGMTTFIAKWKQSNSALIRKVRQLTNRHNQSQTSRIYDEFYFTGYVELAPGKVRYLDWLDSRGIDLDNFQDYDYRIMEDLILNVVFGINLDTQASSYVDAITKLMKRLNNYRIDVLGKAESANLIDYHISTVYCASSPTIGTKVLIDYSIPIQIIASRNSGDQLIKYDTGSPVRPSTLGSEHRFHSNAKMKSVSCKSTVVTSMTNHYKTDLTLRNHDGERS